jgi:hypothetical protein
MNQHHLELYHKKGFLVFPEIHISIEDFIEQKIAKSDFCVKFYESDETTVRSYYGFHKDPEIANWISKNNVIKLYPNNNLNTNSFIFEVRKAKADEVLKQLNDAGICQIKFKGII